MYQEKYYSNTTEVLRDFFSKPLTLALAIVLSGIVLLQYLLNRLNSIGFPLDIFSFTPAACYFILYFKAKSKNPYISFNAPLTIIKICNIITTILNGLVILMLGFFSLLLFATSKEFGDNTSILGFVFIFITFLSLIYLFYSISVTIFISSLKRTSISDKLKTKGALLTAVSGFSFIGICAFFAITIIFSISIIEKGFNEIFTVTDNSSLGLFNSATLSLISSSLSGVSIIMTSAYALYYKNFIKKASKSYSPQPKDYVTPYQNIYGSEEIPSMAYNRGTAPDPLFKDNKSIPLDQRTSCPSCNSIVELNITFCPHCGYKLVKPEENIPIS